MELDELKQMWAQATRFAPVIPDEQLVRLLIHRVAQAKRALWRKFIGELLLILAIYTAFGIAVWWWGDRIQPFVYKIVGAITLLTIPLLASLFRSFHHFNQTERASNIAAHLTETIQRFRQSMRWYGLMTYGCGGLIVLICLTDHSFLTSPSWVKLYTWLHTLSVLLLTPFYLRWMYGRRIEQLESVLHQLQRLS